MQTGLEPPAGFAVQWGRDIGLTVLKDSQAQHVNVTMNIGTQQPSLLAHAPPEKLNKDLQKFRKWLKNHYKGRAKIQGIFGKPFPLDEGYIHLQLTYATQVSINKDLTQPTSTEGQTPAHAPAALSPEADLTLLPGQRVKTHAELHQHKHRMALSQLFAPTKTFLKNDVQDYTSRAEEQVIPEWVIVKGDAGYGKTTTLNFLAHRWTEGALLQEFAEVFLIRLRELPTGAPDWDIIQWVYALYDIGQDGMFEAASFRTMWREEIHPLIEAKQVLFMLDGLDELPDNHCFKKMIMMFETHHYPCLLSSRPLAVDRYRSNTVRELEVIGFADDNIQRYVEFYFKNSVECPLTEAPITALLDDLRRYPLVWDIAHIPVILNAICGIIEQGLKDKVSLDSLLKEFTSLGQIYDYIELALMLRAYRKNTQNEEALSLHRCTPPQRKAALVKQFEMERAILAEVAWEGLAVGQLEISHGVLAKVLDTHGIKTDDADAQWAMQSRLLSLGVLKVVGESKSLELQKYEYLHKTLQESNAAAYLAELKEPARFQAIIGAIKLNPAYQKVIVYLAHQLRADAEKFGWLMEALEAPPHDLLRHYETGLKVRCVEEILSVSWQEASSFIAWLDRKEAKRQAWIDKQLKPLQWRIYQLWEGFKAGRLEQDSPMSADISALQASALWLNQSGEKDVLALVKPNAEESWATQAFLQWLRLTTPKVVEWIQADIALWGLISHLDEKKIATPGFLKKLALCLQATELPVLEAAIDAVNVLGAHAATPEILEALALCLQAKAPRVRVTALKVVSALGAHAATPEILEALALGLQATELPVLEAAIDAVNVLGAHAATPEILEVLLLRLQYIEEWVRCDALKAVSALGAHAATPEILEALALGLQAKAPRVRVAALNAVRALGAHAATPEILEALALCLQAKAPRVRVTALKVVSALGAHAATPEILEALALGLQATELPVLEAAIDAVKVLGAHAATPEILEVLALCLQAKAPRVRIIVLSAVRALGAHAATPEILEALALGLQATEWPVLEAALEAVSAFGAHAATPEILEALALCLQATEWSVLESALDAVRALGTHAATPEILKGLALGLQDIEEWVRVATFNGVSTFGTHAATPEILEALTLGLHDKEPRVCVAAFNAVKALTVKYLKQKHSGSIKEESDLSLLLALLEGAYLAGDVSMQVTSSSEGEAMYYLQGYIQQSAFKIELSLEQAKWFYHIAPKAIDGMQQGQWSQLTINHLTHANWDFLNIFSTPEQHLKSLPPPPNIGLTNTY